MARPSVTLALALMAAASTTHAAAPTQEQFLTELRRLAERVEKLEQRNAVLQNMITPGAEAHGSALTSRVEALEQLNRDINASMVSGRISANEPELITRLKAVESASLSYQKQARKIESLDEISAEANMLAVAQRINRNGRTSNTPENLLNWRGDVSVALPGGSMGNANGQFFAHVRLGQGEGFTLQRPAYSSTLNASNFQLDNPDSQRNTANSTVLLAQAWYQLNVPLPLGGFAVRSKEHIEINVGKMDPFVFFDQNSFADNEAEKFLNSVFVHNPMLDAGGAMGVDDYGFTPGLRVAYHSDQSSPEWWRTSVGIFGAGSGATFGKSFNQPMLIGQLEFGRKFFGGLDGTYRVYAWRNSQYEGFDSAIGTTTGWGMSVDQRVDSDVAFFARYGQSTSGKTSFDRTLTVGAEITGNAWGRGADSVGLAWGWLRSGNNFRRETAADPTLAGYAASGVEQIAELYYRGYLNPRLSLTPDLQFIHRAGANGDADLVTAAGVRALYAF